MQCCITFHFVKVDITNSKVQQNQFISIIRLYQNQMVLKYFLENNKCEITIIIIHIKLIISIKRRNDRIGIILIKCVIKRLL